MTSTPPATASLLKKILQQNQKGNFREGISLFIQNSHDFRSLGSKQYRQVQNQVLNTLAPSQLMYQWFAPLRCTQEMYRNAWAFSPEERKRLAEELFQDIERPNLFTMHALQKVQLTISEEETENSFETYDKMCNFNSTQGSADLLALSTHLHQMRACALLERDDLAEEIYHYTQRKNFIASGMQLHNAMLDVYAEARNPKAFELFNTFLDANMKLNSQTFVNYIKACLFMDERAKLVELSEYMRVHGILYSELPELHRKEVVHALELYREKAKQEEHYQNEMAQLPDRLKPITEAESSDPFTEIRRVRPWGRINDGYDKQNFLVRIRRILKSYAEDKNVSVKQKRFQYDEAQREAGRLERISSVTSHQI